MKMCLNWKVLAGLGALGVGVLVVSPGLLSAALPVLLLVACPLSMLVMMVGMNRMGRMEGNQSAASPRTTVAATGSRDNQLAQLRRELDEVGARQAAIVARMRAVEVTETPRLPSGDPLTAEQTRTR